MDPIGKRIQTGAQTFGFARQRPQSPHPTQALEGLTSSALTPSDRTDSYEQKVQRALVGFWDEIDAGRFEVTDPTGHRGSTDYDPRTQVATNHQSYSAQLRFTDIRIPVSGQAVAFPPLSLTMDRTHTVGRSADQDTYQLALRFASPQKEAERPYLFSIAYSGRWPDPEPVKGWRRLFTKDTSVSRIQFAPNLPEIECDAKRHPDLHRAVKRLMLGALTHEKTKTLWQPFLREIPPT